MLAILINDLSNIDSDASDVDYRSLNDKDGDGVADIVDLDDDNDGILDTEEGAFPPEVVDFSNSLDGTTSSGVVVTGTLFEDAVDDASPDIFDNDNFTFVTGASAIDGKRLNFDEADIAGLPQPLTFDFSGPTAVSEVYLHINSLDTFRFELLAAENPNIGFEILSGINFTQSGTGGDLNFGDDDISDFDTSAREDAEDGVGGGSADGTIRFFTLDGSPVTELNFELVEQPGRSPAVEGWYLAMELVTTRDTDLDGISDHCDLDSDNDGISDLVESGDAAGIALDANGDGTIDLTEGVDSDGDGLIDVFEDGDLTADVGTPPIDTDGDGIDDYLDLDSDNDGIADAVEAQPTVGYQTPAIGSDSDSDGIVDTFDSVAGHGGTFTVPQDTDGDGVADYRDLDSDGDFVSDTNESGLTLSGDDLDGDGIDDAVNASYLDTDGDVSDPINDLSNNDSDASDVDYRSLNDKDGDGVSDVDDLDDDNDGILDSAEGLTQTTLAGDSTNGVGGFDQIAGTGSPSALAVGDVYIVPDGLVAPDGSLLDLRIEVKELNFSDANEFVTLNIPAVDNVPRVSIRNFDAIDTDNVILGITFIEAGSAVVGSDAGIPAELFNVNVDQGDIEAATDNSDLSEFGSIGNAVDLSGNPVNATTSILNPDISTVTTATTLSGGTTIPGFNEYIVTDPTQAGDPTNFEDEGTSNNAAISTGRFAFDSLSSFDWAYGLTGTSGSSTRTTSISISALNALDTDMDGVPDHCDLDSDNDGISDLVESGDAAGIALDANGDGTIDLTEGVDSDGDGLIDIFEDGDLTADIGTVAVDSDGDGVQDYLDLDSDDDGIPDIVEAQPTGTYVALTGNDADGDGVDDAFDMTAGFGGDFTPVENTDGADNPDYLDTGSDNDGLSDSAESGLTLTGIDANGDGIDDGVNASYLDPDGDVNNPTTDLANQAGDTSEVGYREVVTDLVTVKTLASGDSTPDEGDVVTFEIEVTNNGDANATNVVLTDSLPAGITLTGGTVSQGTYDVDTGLWTIGALNNGAIATITLTGTVDVGEGGNTITNVASAAMGDQTDPSTVGDDLVESIIVNDAADLVTVKSLASGDSTPAEGDEVTFEITVTNGGAAQATNVSLTDSLPTGITFTSSTVSQGSYDPATGLFTIGTLNEGNIATITLTGTVDVGQGGNTITNVTTAATGDQMDPSTAGDDLSEAVVVDNTTDLVTVKTLASGDTTPDEGDTVTFQIDVTNNGAAQATNVSLTDLLPTGITLTGGTISQGNYDTTTGLWTIGTLDDGAVATITLVGTVDVGQGGNTITNITTAATGDQDDPSTVGDDLEESVVVNDAADLVTVKTLASGNPTLAEGDTVTFQIDVSNDGAAQATGVSLTDSLPAGITFTTSTVSQGTYDAATGLFDIGTLNVGQTATITLSGTVDAGEGGNTITNITTAATGDQVDPSTVGDDLDESVVVNDAADLVTVKTLASGSSTPAEGDTVTFQIDVTNNGAAQATNVSLTDLLPAGITLTGGSVSQGTYDTATGLFDIGTLNVGEIATITLNGTVDAGQGGNTITNVTTAATGDQIDPSTVGDDLVESVDVVDNTTDLVTVKNTRQW